MIFIHHLHLHLLSSSSCIHFSYAPNKNAVLFITYFHELSLPVSVVMTTTRERKESVSTDNNENKNDIIKPENVIARLAQCKPLKSVNPASYHEGRNDR